MGRETGWERVGEGQRETERDRQKQREIRRDRQTEEESIISVKHRLQFCPRNCFSITGVIYYQCQKNPLNKTVWVCQSCN